MPYYGGEISNEEWKDDNWKYGIEASAAELIFSTTLTHNKHIVAFYTAAQRNKFLSFSENIQLIKDLYMID